MRRQIRAAGRRGIGTSAPWCRRFGVPGCRRFGVPWCRRFEVSRCRRFGAPGCRRFGGGGGGWGGKGRTVIARPARRLRRPFAERIFVVSRPRFSAWVGVGWQRLRLRPRGCLAARWLATARRRPLSRCLPQPEDPHEHAVPLTLQASRRTRLLASRFEGRGQRSGVDKRRCRRLDGSFAMRRARGSGTVSSAPLRARRRQCPGWRSSAGSVPA